MKYKIGDVITVKSFEEIEKITEVNLSYSKLLFPKSKETIFGFNTEMKPFCNKSYKIREIREDYICVEGVQGWYFAGWMIKDSINKFELE